MTLPHYNMPPLTPHKELDDLLARVRNAPPMTDEELAAQRRSFAYGNASFENPDITRAMVYREDAKPTPTIPQMEDRHERHVFTDKTERVVNQVLAFALTVLAVVFVGGLMYKTFVWGY
jgi:hypothetical protein